MTNDYVNHFVKTLNEDTCRMRFWNRSERKIAPCHEPAVYLRQRNGRGSARIPHLCYIIQRDVRYKRSVTSTGFSANAKFISNNYGYYYVRRYLENYTH